jgi:hypothetical protein
MPSLERDNLLTLHRHIYSEQDLKRRYGKFVRSGTGIWLASGRDFTDRILRQSGFNAEQDNGRIAAISDPDGNPILYVYGMSAGGRLSEPTIESRNETLRVLRELALGTGIDIQPPEIRSLSDLYGLKPTGF